MHKFERVMTECGYVRTSYGSVLEFSGLRPFLVGHIHHGMKNETQLSVKYSAIMFMT